MKLLVTVFAAAIVFAAPVLAQSADEAYMQCQHQTILRIDDGVSAPSRIGQQVAAACVSQFRAMGTGAAYDSAFGRRKMEELNLDLSTRAVVLTRRHIAKNKGK